MKRVLKIIVVMAMILALGQCVAAQQDIDIMTNTMWYDESDRYPGNGYDIEITVNNYWGLPIEIQLIQVHMDWQGPDEHFNDYNIHWLNDGESAFTTIHVDIPPDAAIGNHMYDVNVEFDVHDPAGVYYTTWSEGFDGFFVEQSWGDPGGGDPGGGDPGGGDPGDGDPGDGDGEGGMGGIFGEGGISIDWGSIDGAIPAGTMVMLFIITFICLFVVIPVVYYFARK